MYRHRDQDTMAPLHRDQDTVAPLHRDRLVAYTFYMRIYGVCTALYALSLYIIV